MNIGNPDEMTMLELAREIIAAHRQLAAGSSTSRFRRTTRRSASPTSPGPEPSSGGRPRVNRKEGLGKTIEYFRSVIG